MKKKLLYYYYYYYYYYYKNNKKNKNSNIVIAISSAGLAYNFLILLKFSEPDTKTIITFMHS